MILNRHKKFSINSRSKVSGSGLHALKVPSHSLPICLFIQARGLELGDFPIRKAPHVRPEKGWVGSWKEPLSSIVAQLGLEREHATPKKQDPPFFPRSDRDCSDLFNFQSSSSLFSSSSSTAELYLEMGRLQETRNCIDDATLISKLNHQVLYMVSCLSVEQTERVIRILARVFLPLPPQKGRLHEVKREFREARKAYETAVAINPSHVKAQQRLVSPHLGCSSSKFDRKKEEFRF